MVIQTYNPENFSIECAREQDYDSFYKIEIDLREKLKYPPFCDIILIGMTSSKEEEIIKVSDKLYHIIKKNSQNYSLLLTKPQPSPIDKIKNQYRWRMILKCKFNSSIVNLINSSLEELYKQKYKQTRITIDVNPNSMM